MKFRWRVLVKEEIENVRYISKPPPLEINQTELG